ncbi:unnamed protein product [Diamesa serratosioi]
MNTATAERQTCLNESPYHNQQLQDTQHTFYHGNDNYEHTSWYWNMNHVPNEDLLVNAKKAYFKSKNASSQQPSAQRSSNSSFQSFFRWFKKDERKQYNGQSEDTQDPNDIISTVQDFENNLDPPNAQEFEGYESSDTLSPPSSPKLGYSASRNNSSCDSIFSTATSSFAFVPAIDYLLQQQGGKSKESTGTDRPYTDSYHRRLKDRDHAREQDRKYNLTLRKKYKLYTDVELQKNDKQASGYDNNLFNKYSNNSTELINQTVHNKLRHRRSTSDSSKDKKSGAYIHVKGKRKAPPPPSPPQLVKNNFSPQSTLGRKKRPAPLPPTTLTSSSNKLQDTILSTSLLEDLEIKSIIDGTSKSLSRNFSPETMKNTSVKMEQTTTSDIYVKTNGIQESPREVSIDNGFKSSNEDQSLNTNLILNSVELREKPSPLPSSPRPWYKRGSANKDTLKGASSKLNFFTRDKKKDREMDKRRSGIFMPNISELDKEAAEIVEAARLKKLQESKKVPEQLVLQYQMNGLDSILDDNEGTSPKSAKELIGLFEASSSHANRITLNPAFIARQDFFGDKKTKFGFDFSDNSIKEKPPTKLPEVDNNAKKKTSEGLLGIWHCPYCTLANQNWKIICQACEKIKPYDKRYCGAEKNKAIEDKPVTKNSWDEKQEQMLKYFNPVPRVPELKSEPISIPDIASKTETLEDKLTNELFEMSYVQSKLSDKEQATAAEKLNDNRRASFEKKVIDKIDFSDPKALELEKERLRDKIRAMNSKALADKYPVIKKIEHSITVTPTVEPTMPQTGAIKKQFPRKPIKPLTEITEKVDNMESKMQGELDQKTTKILAQNSNEKPPKKPETNNLAKSRDNLPISPQLTAKHNFKYENDFNLPLKIELNANKNTNTIAINKILRKLENAISDGKYDDAANLATDLAKMKVSLSVTRQMNNANSKITMKLTDIVVNLIVEDAISNKVPLKVKISPQMTLGELKSQMFRNYEIPVHLQKWNINSKAAEDNVKTLVDYQVYDNTAIIKLLVPGSTRDYLKLRPITNYIKETKLLDIATNNNDNDNDNNNANTDSESDDEKQNEKVEKSHYMELVNLESSNIVPNMEKFECTICFSDVQPKLGAVLRDCLHHFCKECLVMHIQHNDDVEIKCPFMDNTYSCQSMLQDREVRSLLSKEEYEKYLSKSIRQAEHQIENTFHCKTVNCRGWCVFEEDVNTFKCPVCTIVNCLTCGAIHDGLNCKQYQDHLNIDSECLDTKKTKETLQEMIDKNEAMHCPTCQIFLLKKWGCDWLKCTFCKTEICWCTKGLRWGINGKGDTSGGCKCGVNGVKCSPKCNYCH